MPFKYFILFVFCPLFGFCQRKTPCLQFPRGLSTDYTLTDATQDFKRLEQNLDKDTIIVRHGIEFPHSALRIRAARANRVYLFDSTGVMGQKAKLILDTLMQRHVQKVEHTLQGTWDWEWSGTNGLTDNPWGQSPQRCKCTQKMEIGRDSVSFWANDTLVQKTAYILNIAPWQIGYDFVYFQIEGSDCWVVEMSEVSHAFLASDDKGEFLNINRVAGCACGCPIDVYKRPKKAGP